MTKIFDRRLLLAATAASLAIVITVFDAQLRAQSGAQALPNLGQHITPLAVPGARFEPLSPNLPDNPGWLAGQAVTTVTSPDRKTLLVLTSGYNRVFFSDGPNKGTVNPADSAEYVFVYDISTSTPVKTQVLKFANTFNGIAFDPSGQAFYVSGCSDDNVHVVTRSGSGVWQERPDTPPLPLGHKAGLGLAIPPDSGSVPINDRVGVKPCAAGVAVSNDGLTLVVTNYYNDSITVFNKPQGMGYWWKVTELDLRPGKSDVLDAGVPGGSYPFWVTVKGSGASAKAYVSSVRDREIVVVDLGGAPAVTARIHVRGQPLKMTMNAAQSLLYVVEDQSDTVDIIDTKRDVVVESIPVIAPHSILPDWLEPYTGANPNGVTLSPDERYLYVTNGNLNCVAVVALSGMNSGDRVVGLIPTGWYPNSTSFSADGDTVYVVNGKSPTGPNPGFCYDGPPGSPNCMAANQYNPQLIKAGLQYFPRPSTSQLATMTSRVADNNRFSSSVSARDASVMAAVRRGVKHVIFIIKENRTYDQVLGDLPVGNGDPALTEFGAAITPNHHALARSFVTLDNFYAASEVSYDGWPWTTSARAPEVVQLQWPGAYAGRAFSLDSEGQNRGVNVAYPTLAERRAANPFTPDDPDLLPGQTNAAAPDGPDNEVNTGYVWDAALRAGLKVRNYGFFADTTRYSTANFAIPLLRNPAATKTQVTFPTSASLAPFTDLFFRGFDNAFPDYYRYKEWEREFDADYPPQPSAGDADGRTPGPSSAGGLPALSLVRFMHDHTGDFAKAIDGVNTPELQQADNDYAVGLLVEKISKSKYANDTLIFVIEDDAQDGGDHVDSHRTIAFVAGAYVKQGAVVSTSYNTIDFLRTIEMVLGLPPLNLNDALAKPMADIFTTAPRQWRFTATPSAYLYATQLPLPPRPAGLAVPRSTHDASYWANVTSGMDFSTEDRFDFAAYNRVLWTGLMGDVPYPASSSGRDLRKNRKALLAEHRRTLGGQTR